MQRANSIAQGRLEGDGTSAVIAAISALDKAAEKGIIHPNNAARRKSRLMAKANAAHLLDGAAAGWYTWVFQTVVVPPSCGSGGTGRRASLRSLWPQGRGGSNPLFRTIRLAMAGRLASLPVRLARGTPSIHSAASRMPCSERNESKGC